MYNIVSFSFGKRFTNEIFLERVILMTNSIFKVLLPLATLLIIMAAYYIQKKMKKSQLASIFMINFVSVIIWNLGMIGQLFLSEPLGIAPIYFDYIAYIGICFLPIGLLYTGIVFVRTKVKLKRIDLILLAVPFISLFVLWTNDLHHLFYKEYSTQINECVFGPYFIIHTIFSYGAIGVGMLSLIRYNIKNSGFFSKQSILIVIGSSIPTLVNLLATLGVFKTSIYVTPLTFTVALLFYVFAIFKFQFLNITPIALQNVVNHISDSYLVLDENYQIIDFNDTFLKTFHVNSTAIRNVNFFDLLENHKELPVNISVLKSGIQKAHKTGKCIAYEKEFASISKFFNIEITSIDSNKNILGTLILLKDTTQHILDMETIKNNQDKLMERERLASLGQLIGGIAHNLKTPIMSISGAAEGISDLIKEYDASIGDPEVTAEDHHAIAKDMSEWVGKIKAHTEYMSDIITAVKGQAVTFSETQDTYFSVDELLKRVDILMRHELKNALVTLNMYSTVSSLSLHGNVNSLVQVINNMISNAIQAYKGVPNTIIELNVNKQDDSTLDIAIKDFAGGVPKNVQDKLFKQMITTKGKNGTGLGLFMSYSNIRAHFNGTITLDVDEGVGSTFHILLPIS